MIKGILTRLIQEIDSHQVWTRRSILLLILFSIFHLILSVINLDNIVWFVNWESSKMIAYGIPMYEQSGSVYSPTAGSHSVPPDHFPLYFYLMAVVVIVFGPNQYIARTITWAFVMLSFYFLYKIVKPKLERELLFLQVLYFLDPQLIVTNYYGKFDQIAMFFIVAAFYLMSIDRYGFAGIILGLGIMVKFFPVFAFLVFSAYLLRKLEIQRLIGFVLSTLLSTGIIFLYHWYRWRDLFLDVIIYQINRYTPSLSLWYYILPADLSGTTLLIPQFIFMAIVGLYILASNVNNSWYKPLLATSTLSAAFLTITRQYYSTYIYFVSVPLLPVILMWFRKKNYKPIIYTISAYLIFHLGTLFCYNSCYPQKLDFSIFSWIGVSFVFIGTVLFVPAYSFFQNDLSNNENNE